MRLTFFLDQNQFRNFCFPDVSPVVAVVVVKVAAVVIVVVVVVPC
jgi:hypothetical protein